MKTLQHTCSLLTILSAAMFSHAAAAQQAQTPGRIAQPSSTAMSPGVASDVISISGTVRAIDPASRVVTLEGKDGKTARVLVGPDIRNFDQLSRGDKVNLRYMQATAVALDKGADPGALRQRVESSAFGQTPQGAKPGLKAMEQTTVVANVFQVDRDAGVLTLRGTDGTPVDIRVRDKQMLSNVATGDQIVISYVEATALAIQPQ